MRPNYRWIGTALIVLCCLYVFSFFTLSRIAIRKAVARGDGIFYDFVDPTSPSSRAMNHALKYLYWPLVEIDLRFGAGWYPGPEPHGSLSMRGNRSGRIAGDTIPNSAAWEALAFCQCRPDSPRLWGAGERKCGIEKTSTTKKIAKPMAADLDSPSRFGKATPRTASTMAIE